jgi:co-chaperonin GroES (HSP10)
MALNYDKVIKGNLKPLHNRVIVADMHFGEQRTKGGLIIKDDDGKTMGIHPRWGRVYKKGPENVDAYDVGDWVLVEHGRWTRSFKVDDGEEINELRMVETESIMGWAKEKPKDDIILGKEYKDGESATIDPSSFINI